MSAFDDREKEFEAKFKHDQDIQFKVVARRNRLLGEWAGQEMGLSGEALVTYSKDVVMSDFQQPGDDDVLQKVQADLKAAGIDLEQSRLRKKMDELLQLSKEQVMSE
ncbi:MAG: DUF1476 domain-containing protein [Alphaproteobacteria bacterium]|jgi:hypothetical protein